jgi:hypothetical protein
VTLATLARYPAWGTLALPLHGQLYIRRADRDQLPPERRRPFRTKLAMAAAQLVWLNTWAGHHFTERWAVVDGAYAKRPFLRPAREQGFKVVSRLRKDAALWSLPKAVPEAQRGPRRPSTYGKKRISLANWAGQPRGWHAMTCTQDGAPASKTIQTFLATWRPAGGVIRVVLVKEPDGWLPFFFVDPEATPQEILEAIADRGAEEHTFKDVKEVCGAGPQQVRNVHNNEGCFNLTLWLHTLMEAWAWAEAEERLVDRSASPWDSVPRRPSHADKRKALRRAVLQGEIDEVLAGRPSNEKIRR